MRLSECKINDKVRLDNVDYQVRKSIFHVHGLTISNSVLNLVTLERNNITYHVCGNTEVELIEKIKLGVWEGISGDIYYLFYKDGNTYYGIDIDYPTDVYSWTKLEAGSYTLVKYLREFP